MDGRQGQEFGVAIGSVIEMSWARVTLEQTEKDHGLDEGQG